MTLSKAQKDFIEGAVDYLLDFSSDEVKLKNEALNLKQALSQPVEQQHDYYFIRECLYNPTGSLKGLEKHGVPPPEINATNPVDDESNPTSANANKNSPPTIGEVQEYLLNFVLRTLENKAKEIHLTLNELSLEKKDIDLAFMPQKNFSTFFRSLIEQPVGYFPWQMIYNEGDVHFSSLNVSENNLYIDLRITAYLPYETSITTIRNFRPIPADVYQNNLLMSLIPQAKMIAAQEVKQDILNRLLTLYDFDTLLYFYSWFDNNFTKIITNEYYLLVLLTDPNYFYAFLNLPENQVDALINPVAVNLLKNNLCDLKTAKNLTNSQIAIAGSYYFLLKEDKVNMANISLLNNDQCRMLSQPILMNLIKQNKLSFFAAARLPNTLIPLFSSPFYQDFFLRQDIEWSQLSKIRSHHCDFLLKEDVAKLILNNIFDITHTHKLNFKELELIPKKNISHLLLEKKFSMRDLHYAFSKNLFFIESHQDIYAWMLADILQINNLDATKPLSTYGLAYGRRLYAIFKNKPYTINGSIDDIEQIIKELPAASTLLQVSLGYLQENLIGYFILELREYLKIIDISKLRSKDLKVYDQLNNLINNYDNKNKTWNGTLADLIDVANKILAGPKCTLARLSFPFFKDNNHYAKEIQKICVGLTKFSGLIQPKPVEETSRCLLSRIS